MIIVDELFICQSESNSLYSISHISKTKPTRNGRWAPWSSVVWLFQIPKCNGGKCCYYVLGHNDPVCAFLQWQVPFSTGLREIQSSISSNSISRSLDEMILYQNKYFCCTTLDSEWKVSSPNRTWWLHDEYRVAVTRKVWTLSERVRESPFNHIHFARSDWFPQQ
jgi:hypothetical protein